ncbi:MAG TPA: N,N-dimethylformamidase beta subunit family domain-containing protein, partial [Pirellulales bacterium]
MDASHDSSLPRRDFLRGALAAGALSAAGTPGANAQQAKAAETPREERNAAQQRENPIIAENKKPGAIDWQLTRVRVDAPGFRSPWIEGFCSHQSVRSGDELTVFVSTNPARKYRLEIFRMGYYGGRGARLMQTLGPFEGTVQPTPTPGEKNLHECRWTPGVKLTI